MDDHSDFEDSSPEAMAELLAEMRSSQLPLRRAASRLLVLGANGVLVPLPGKGQQQYALVGTKPEVESAFLTGEATLTALEEGKAFAGTQPSLVTDLDVALEVAARAAGLCLALENTMPPAYFIAGELTSVELLASTLRDQPE